MALSPRWREVRKLVFQRQGHPAAIPGRQVGGDEDLEGMKTFASIGVGHRLAPKRLDHVVVIERMTEAVYRRRLVAGLFDHLVVRIGLGELPVIDEVHGYAPDPHGSLLSDDGDGS